MKKEDIESMLSRANVLQDERKALESERAEVSEKAFEIQAKLEKLDDRIKTVVQEIRSILGGGSEDLQSRALGTRAKQVLEFMAGKGVVNCKDVATSVYGDAETIHYQGAHSALISLKRRGLVRKVGRGLWEIAAVQAEILSNGADERESVSG